MSEQIDRLIDDTARELTTGSPSPALREGVRARLAPGRPWWRVPLWQPALGAAVLTVAILLTLRPETKAPVVAPTVQPTVAAAAAPAVVAGPVAPPPVRVIRRVERAQFAFAADDSPVEQLVVEPINAEPIATAVAVVEDVSAPMPLSIAGLEIRPLPGE
jgi:hypothetical protein